MAELEIKGIDTAALPEPKRTLRTITIAVMAVTALASALLAWSLLPDARYALAKPNAVELPALDAATLAAHAGLFVRTRVKLANPAATFRRPFEPSRYQVAQVEGQADPPVYVIYTLPDGYSEQRFLPPALVAGRLARADQLGARFRGVGSVVPSTAWVLVDGEDPYGHSWLLGLEAMLLIFLAFNVAAIARVVRRVA